MSTESPVLLFNHFMAQSLFPTFFSRESDGKRQTSAEGMYVAIGLCITAIFAIWDSNAVLMVN